jgi:hypothetical protein
MLFAGITQSVYRLATGWTAERSEFESRQGARISPLHVVHTGSGAHPASYPVDMEGPFPGRKAAGE